MGLKIYTVGDLCKILRIHRTYVSRLINKGSIKAIKIGRSYRVLEEDLEQFIGGEVEGPLLEIEDIASILKIHRLYVIRLIREKKIKAIKIGKFYRIHPDSLANFVGQKKIKRILTVDEVSRLLQINRVTVIDLIKKKKLKAFKIGKFYRLTEKMLNNFLKVKTVK